MPIDDKIGKDITKVLCKFPYVQLAILFGSLLGTGSRRDSDLDLAIQTAGKCTKEQKIELTEELAKAFGRPVDLVDLSEVGGATARANPKEGSASYWQRFFVCGITQEAYFCPSGFCTLSATNP